MRLRWEHCMRRQGQINGSGRKWHFAGLLLCLVALNLSGCVTSRPSVNWTSLTAAKESNDLQVVRVTAEDRRGCILLTTEFNRDLNDFVPCTNAPNTRLGGELIEFYIVTSPDSDDLIEPFGAADSARLIPRYSHHISVDLQSWRVYPPAVSYWFGFDTGLELGQRGDEANQVFVLGAEVRASFTRILSPRCSGMFDGEELLRERKLSWRALVRWRTNLVQVTIPHDFIGFAPERKIRIFFGAERNCPLNARGWKREFSDPKQVMISSSGGGLNGLQDGRSRWECFERAARRGDLGYVKQQVQAGIPRAMWDVGLLAAVDGGHVGVVEYFLDKGVSANLAGGATYRTIILVR